MRTKLLENIKRKSDRYLAAAKKWGSLPDTTKTMRAVAVDRFGPPSALVLRELPVPKPGPREVLIAIHTAGVGSWDASIRNGSWRKPGRSARSQFNLLCTVELTWSRQRPAHPRRVW